SIPLEYWTLFRDEGAVGALEVARLHADRLRLRFRLDRLIKAHRPFLVELRLGDAMREGRAGCQLLRQLQRFGLECVGFNEAVVVAPALAFRRAHRAAGIKQLRRTALADDAREHGAGAHV